MNQEMIDRITASYMEKKPLYSEFCITMRSLLIQILDSNGYKYQISHRIKSLDSTIEKFNTKLGEGNRYRGLEDINDLAGIRIVFYLESDKRCFVADLYRELTPQNLKLKERHREKGYRATHVIAAFGKKRLGLSEYKRFTGMKCEIQLTSALYHAWSEIEHDIFYKQNFSRVDQAKDVKKLKRELENTMTKYIEKASDSFESVAQKIKQIRKVEKM